MKRVGLATLSFWLLALPVAAAPPRTIGDLGLVLIYVEPGTFAMGSPESEAGRRSHEVPHQVTLTKGYWLGKTEVTQAQWTAVMGYNPSHHKGDTLPVEQVSWVDAMMFCLKLTRRESAANRLPDGYVYTLPTEAQWEYACRAGTGGPYPGELDAMAWYEMNSGFETHDVGTKQANAWGFSDMLGNVGEWCLDWYVAKFSGDAVTDPYVDRLPASIVAFRSIRGGGFGSAAPSCRSASRTNNSPEVRAAPLGFRLALSVSPKGAPNPNSGDGVP